MSEYFIATESKTCGVMAFCERGKWIEVEKRNGIRSSEPWIPLDISLARNNPTNFVNFGGFLTCDESCWENYFLPIREKSDGLEGLAINSEYGKYYIINVYFNDEVLDYENSTFFRDPFSGKILNILKYAFQND